MQFQLMQMQNNDTWCLWYTRGLGITLFSPKNGHGVRVAKIKAGSPARRTSNLHELDVILEVNGVATFSSNKNQRVWTTHQEVVELLVRAGKWVRRSARSAVALSVI